MRSICSADVLCNVSCLCVVWFVCMCYDVWSYIVTCRYSSESVDNFTELLVPQSSCGKSYLGTCITANCSQTIYVHGKVDQWETLHHVGLMIRDPISLHFYVLLQQAIQCIDSL